MPLTLPARLALVALTLLCAALLGGRAEAAIYYVSPTGSDAGAGTSPATAWQTAAKVNNATLKPGDQVLFQAGATFKGPLVPWSSGSPVAPITFGSWGQGRATIESRDNNVVYVLGVQWVTLQNLYLTADGTNSHIVVSDPTRTSAYVTIRGCVIANTAAFGINDANPSDNHWTIANNLVSDTDQTGITFRGSDFTVAGNTVLRTGRHPSEGAHGIYAKGPRAVVVGNSVTDFSASGISFRYQSSVIEGNAISGGRIGLSYFQDKEVTTGGRTVVAFNRIANVTDAGMYFDDSALESFVVANNSVQVVSGIGLNIHRVKGLWLANNVVTGAFDRYALLARAPSGPYHEFHNAWYPAATFGWNGVDRTFDAYRKVSRQGKGDLVADPLLTAGFVPKAASPLVDAGARNVASLRFVARCDGKPFSYCAKAPDIGAVERRSAGPSPRKTS